MGVCITYVGCQTIVTEDRTHDSRVAGAGVVGVAVGGLLARCRGGAVAVARWLFVFLR